jgi:putative ABC transport system permease protein
MKNVFKIAWRNLFRYQRRTLLTGALIAIGVIFMIVVSGVGNSFKAQVTGELTNASLGDLQIHAAGFLDSIDSNPLEMTLSGEELQQIEQILDDNERIKAYSKRIRFGGMLSNLDKTISLRLTAIIPEMEGQTCPGLPQRILERTSDEAQFLKPGKFWYRKISPKDFSWRSAVMWLSSRQIRKAQSMG